MGTEFDRRNSEKRLPPVPKTRKLDLVEDIHGYPIADPYRWLEEDSSEEVHEWLEAQEQRTRTYIDAIPGREKIAERLKALFSVDTVSVPVGRKGRYFELKRKGNDEMPVLYVKDGLNGESRVLIDPSTLSEDLTTTLNSWYPSRDGQLLAYKLASAGNDRSDIRVMDVETGKDLIDYIPDDVYPSVYSRIEWNEDSTGFWYSRRSPDVSPDEGKFYQQIFFHKLGTDWHNDPLVYAPNGEKENVPQVSLSQDGRWLLATTYGFSGGDEWTELSILDRNDGKQQFIPVVPREPGVKSFGLVHRDILYVLTNKDAPKCQILRGEVKELQSDTSALAPLILEGRGTIEDYAIVKDTLIVQTLEDVHSVLRRYTLNGELVAELDLPTIGSVEKLSGEIDGNEIFFEFQSFTTPPTIYRLALEEQMPQVYEKMDAGFDTSVINTDQVWYPSKDGTLIPMFLMRRTDVETDDSAPTLLYGYGGFDISLTPRFTKSWIPFVEAGGIVAVANLRGGGEFGKEWHEAGMKEKKQNVFDDFASAAEWLVANGFTTSKKLAVFGGSNGGLLTMTTAVQRPDLIRVAVASVPVADMMRFHLFFGGRHWIPDYGDPDSAESVPYLIKYSPYHNVQNGTEYPAVLIWTGEKDDRVHPSHSFKMAARLQEATISDCPVLLRVELQAGHGGATAVSKFIEQYADMWAFVFDQLGMIE